MEIFKETIKKFWNQKPCGTFGFIPDNPNLSYFNQIRERRYKLEPFIMKEVNIPELKEKKVLEIGCGVGTDGVEITKSGADYTGIDVSEKSLNLAKRNFEINNVSGNFFVVDAENLPFPDNEFDFVYSWGVIHHTPNIKKTAEEICRVLKPDGKICIMIYNRYSLVGLQLYILYGLLRLKPSISWKKLFAEHHESPGTKAFTDKEAISLFKEFRNIEIRNIVTPYDARITRKRYLPVFFRRLIPSCFGFFKIIKGSKK